MWLAPEPHSSPPSAHTTDPAVHQQRGHPSVTSLRLRLEDSSPRRPTVNRGFGDCPSAAVIFLCGVLPIWRLLKPSRTWIADLRASVRRPRRLRPYCTPLEDRCLLSVSLSDIAPAVPYVGSPVIWTAGSRGHGPRAVYRFSVGLQGGALHVVRDFSQSNSFTWNPMQEGIYEIRVDVKSGFAARRSEFTTETYTTRSRVLGNAP